MNNRIRSSAVLLACAALFGPAYGQSGKTVVAEPIAVLPSFSQWAASVALPLVETFSVDINTLRLLQPGAASASANGTVFHPRPVIRGQPELPLLADAPVGPGGSIWGPTFNYQGMHMKVVVLDGRGVRVAQPLSTPLLPGQRFKLRVTPTFESVASLERLVGSTWSLQRAGQLYPAQGMSVHMRAGETVDLPMEANEYFVMNNPSDRMVLSVRHPQARGDAASDQPAYREDDVRGTNYLQLVPQDRYPAIEQQIGISTY